MKAQACLASGKAEEAVKILFELLQKEERAEYLAVLGEAYIQLGDAMQAIEAYAAAAQAEPKNSAYKQKFLDLIRTMEVRQENPGLKQLLLECLKDETLDFSGAGHVWLGVLTYDPVFNEVYEGKKNYSGLLEPFFLLGLQRLVVFNTEFENFLAGLRRDLLNDEQAELKELEEALAVYCAATDYVLYASPEEEKAAHAAESRRQTIARCYFRPPAVTDKTIQSITPVTDAISSAVQGQYEEFPYPRWTHFDPDIKDTEAEGFLLDRKADILVAGCGTGKEAIELASVFPDAKILAVDLSRASLSYGAAKAREFGLDNIEFRHGDILNLGSVGKKFDFIASSGVLHHMQDPLKGWRVLTGLLKDEGVMRVAFYSRAARAKLTEAKKIIREKGYGQSAEEIRRYRHDAPGILSEDVYKYIRSFRDYYYLSECRDLLFHVQEHEYAPLELKEMMDGLGLEFIKFYIGDEKLAAYRKEFPRDKAATDLENWQKFEKKHPETFKEMYRFWCRKAGHGTA